MDVPKMHIHLEAIEKYIKVEPLAYREGYWIR
jgi:hypothetical protein